MKINLKKSLSFFLSLIFVFQFVPISGAAYECVGSESVITANKVPAEEKIYCEATLEDDFSDDCVLVVIDHHRSMNSLNG